jgi:hypothetical protein
MKYFLRTTDKDGKSYCGFQWPLEVGATVTAPDWNPAPSCGNGLHGLLNGEQDGDLLDWSPDALWWIVGVADDAPVIDLEGKCKFESCTVIAFGDRKTVADKMRDLAPGAAVHGSYAASGYRGTSTSGNRGTSTSGYRGTSTSGDYGTSTSGDYGTSTSGYRGTSTSGDYGTSTSGNRGTSTSGYRGTSTSGDYGTSTSGYRGTSTSGDYGTSTSGDYGTSTSGDWGTLVIQWYDGSRYRLAVAYVGENGIKPNTPYKLDDKGDFVEVTK